MTNTEMKLNRDELLYYLLLENRISREEVEYYAEHRIEEINETMNIFDLKNDRAQRLALGLLGTLAQEQGDMVIDSFGSELDFSFESKLSLENFSKEDMKLLLITCLQKPAFYSFAYNTCERIKSRLEEEQEASEEESEIIEETSDYVYVTVVVLTGKAPVVSSLYHADPIIEGFKEEPILEEHIVYNEISGTLRLRGNDQQRVQLEFQFDEASYRDEYEDNIPFGLELRFKTTRDPEGEPVVIDIPANTAPYPYNREAKFMIIRSEDKTDVDCSDGIKAGYTISLKLPENL